MREYEITIYTSNTREVLDLARGRWRILDYLKNSYIMLHSFNDDSELLEDELDLECIEYDEIITVLKCTGRG